PLPASGERKEERAWGSLPSACNLPGGAVLGVGELDAHRREFVADAIGLGPVLRGAGGIAGRDKPLDLIPWDRNGLSLRLPPFIENIPAEAEKGQRARQGLAPGRMFERMHFGNGSGRIEIVE